MVGGAVAHPARAIWRVVASESTAPTYGWGSLRCLAYGVGALRF
jgi:hypothetical protein